MFSTRDRRPVIAPGWRPRLHAYLGGTLRGLGATPLAIGGVEDYVHLLVGIKATHAVADLVRETKKASTEWVRGEQGLRDFRWQEGYAALSVGAPEAVVAYIANQECTIESSIRRTSCAPCSKRPESRSTRGTLNRCDPSEVGNIDLP